MQEFKIEAEATILGGCSAITQAVEACNGLDLCDLHSPDIEPNPAKLGWPLGA
jgi:hypothetical protein